MRLSTKFTAVIMLMILLPVLVLGILLNVNMTQYALSENNAVLESYVVRVVNNVEDHLTQIARTTRLISQDDTYQQALVTPSGVEQEQISQLLEAQTTALVQCRSAFLLDKNGTVVASMSGTRVGEAYAQGEELNKLMRSDSHFSGILYSQQDKTYFFQSQALYQNDSAVGYLVFEFDTSYFTLLARDGVVGGQGYLFFIDAKDNIFAHRYPERQLNASAYDMEDGFYRQLVKMRADKTRENGSLTYEYSNQLELHGVYHFIPQIDGYLVAVRSMDEIREIHLRPLALLNSLLLVAGLMCIAATAIIVVSVRYPASRILRSLGSMLKDSGYVYCTYEADNELGWIAESVNLLNTKITNTLDDLKESEKRYRTALEAVSDIVWEYDVATQKYTFMAKDKGLLGARRVENIGSVNCPWAYAADPEAEDRRDAEFKRFVTGMSRTYRAEYETRDIRGNTAWAESIATALKNKDDKIVKVIGSISDITQKKLYDIRVLHSAEYDKLTSVYNRATIEKRIKELLPEYRQSALMMIDLDNFKIINDTFGHQFGDQILKFVSSSICKMVSGDDLVGRIGGDEFIVFIKEFSSEDELEQTANKIVSALQSGYEKEGTSYRLSGSVGVAKAYEFGAINYKELLANADFAMYSAKRKGKNKYTLFTESLNHEKVKTDVVAEHLRNIAQNDILTVSFEPVFCSRTNLAVRFISDIDILIPEYADISRDEIYKIAAESNQQSLLLETTFRRVCQAVTSVEKFNTHQTIVTYPIPIVSLSNEAVLSILTRVSQEEGVNPKTLGFALEPRTISMFDHSVYTFVSGLRRISSDIELMGFGGMYTSYNIVSDFNLDSVRFADEMIVKATHSRKYLSVLSSIMDIARQSATACTLPLTLKQHEFLKPRLSRCYYYCTGDKLSAQAFYREIQTKEIVMNKYDCPDYKSRLLENTILGL